MPALSLIIPTHKRFRYAEETVETILAMGDDIKLIVCGTSAKNALGRVWRRLTVRFVMTKDERIAGVDTITATKIFDSVITAGTKSDLSRA